MISRSRSSFSSTPEYPHKPTLARPRALRPAALMVDNEFNSAFARELVSDFFRFGLRRIVPELAAAILADEPIALSLGAAEHFNEMLGIPKN